MRPVRCRPVLWRWLGTGSRCTAAPRKIGFTQLVSVHAQYVRGHAPVLEVLGDLPGRVGSSSGRTAIE